MMLPPILLKNRHAFALALLTLLSCSGCREDARGLNSSRTSTQLTGQLTVTGSSTVAPLVAEIARRFEQQYPDVRVDVQTGGSGQGIADARQGIAEIGMASRRLLENEMDLVAHPIAADGVSLIVHESNPVAELSDEQIIGIYTGRIDNWQEVGGSSHPITVVHKAEGRATLDVFLKHFSIDNTSVQADVIVGDPEHGVTTVAGAVGAIGYVSIGTAEADAAAGVPIRLLPLGDVAAATATVASGQFPMSRPLNLVVLHQPDRLTTAFIKYCQSAAVHDLIAALHFVPIDHDDDLDG